MRTLIRGINFGPVIGASGVQGFFGEGYPHHRKFKYIPGFSFRNMGFVAKTVTLSPRPGNMPLEQDGMTPKEKRPNCIRWNLRKGAVLNAVGLSNSGCEFYLAQGRWQARAEPSQLSFMSVSKNDFAEERRQFRNFVQVLGAGLEAFMAPIGLQVNYSCPNTGHKVDQSKHGELEAAVMQDFETAKDLDIAIIPKFNMLLPPELAVKFSRHPRCDAICMSNTLPWGQLPEEVDWKGLFGSTESPLKDLGGGGLSGAPITDLVQRWVNKYSWLNPEKPLIAGGGVMCARDARNLLQYRCVSSVFIGTAAILRPWRVQSIIRAAHAMRD
jgi:dihydroorotate dehydrogenase